MILPLTILALLLVFGYILFKYTALFKPSSIKTKKLPRSLLLYCEYVGDYTQIGPIYRKISIEARPHFKPEDNLCGIFYDNASKLQDKTKGRAVAGLLIGEEERAAAEAIVAKNPDFKLKTLPEIDCIHTILPFEDQAVMLRLLSKAYPQIVEDAIRRKIVRSREEIVAFMEVYPKKDGKSLFEIVLPYGKNVQDFNLTTQPQPQRLIDVTEKKEN